MSSTIYYLLAHPLTDFLTNSLTHLLTHSLILSLCHSGFCCLILVYIAYIYIVVLCSESMITGRVSAIAGACLVLCDMQAECNHRLPSPR